VGGVVISLIITFLKKEVYCSICKKGKKERKTIITLLAQS
jgi:hypothetical protein